jgi:SHS2 domain-containing protein
LVQPPFEILEHPADIGFRAWGRTREEVFENAALALFSLTCDLETVEEKESRAIEVSASEQETLLYAWLAELLAVSEGEHIVFRRAVVSLAGADRVLATVYGEPFDRERHHSGTHIKAVTFHQLKIEESAEGWCAQVFLDL